jgi:hypothetical protein
MRFFLLLLPLSLQKHKQPSMNRFHRPEQGKTRSVMLHVGRPEWREKNRRWTPHSDGSTLSLPPCTSIRSRDPHSFRSRQQHIHFLLFPLLQPCAWRPAHLCGDSDDLLAPLFSQPTDPERRKPCSPRGAPPELRVAARAPRRPAAWMSSRYTRAPVEPALVWRLPAGILAEALLLRSDPATGPLALRRARAAGPLLLHPPTGELRGQPQPAPPAWRAHADGASPALPTPPASEHARPALP